MTDSIANSKDGLWPLLEHFYDGTLLIDPQSWCVVRANSAAAKMLGRTKEAMVGLSVVDLFDEPSGESIRNQLKLGLMGEPSHNPVLAKLAPIKGRGRLVGIQIVQLALDGCAVLGAWMQPTTQAEWHWYCTDPVTNLSNRVLFESKLSSLLRGDGTGNRFAVLFVDLDNFKAVNDEFGHVVGDSALRDAACRLRESVGNDGELVRYGGDEFAVLVENLRYTGTVDTLVNRIRIAFSAPIAIPGGEVQLTASVGVALGPAEYKTPTDMIAAADRAMYAAKRGM